VVAFAALLFFRSKKNASFIEFVGEQTKILLKINHNKCLIDLYSVTKEKN
jgi:hypothetical protein